MHPSSVRISLLLYMFSLCKYPRTTKTLHGTSKKPGSDAMRDTRTSYVMLYYTYLMVCASIIFGDLRSVEIMLDLSPVYNYVLRFTFYGLGRSFALPYPIGYALIRFSLYKKRIWGYSICWRFVISECIR